MIVRLARAGRLLLSALLLLLSVGLLWAPGALAQDAEPRLSAGQRVYDQTGSSLTEQQRADLQQRLIALKAGTGADGLVLVRARDADPEQTLEQVEALQQQRVQATGADQDTAFALLINRNPDDPKDGRAGIFVGSTHDDGNVPRGEQENIVSGALIPPLRDGDVYASLTAGIDRLGSSIRDGPPQSAFQKWAAGAARVWVPLTTVVLALVAAALAARFSRDRPRGHRAPVAPTTRRPTNLSTAIGAALASGGPRGDIVQGVVLELAGRGALALEPEPDARSKKDPSLRVRLQDPGLVGDPVEGVVPGLNWRAGPTVVWWTARRCRGWAVLLVRSRTPRAGSSWSDVGWRRTPRPRARC